MSFKKILKSPFWPAALEFFSTISFLLVLPLIAWGWDDLAGFFSHPVRFSFAVIVIVQALTYSVLIYFSPPQPKPVHRYDLSSWHSYLLEIIFMLAAYCDRRNMLTWGESAPLRWLGLVIYLVGAILSISTHFTWVSHLRRRAELAVENPVLLFEGLYKWVRYPALLNLLFFCLGFAIAMRSWGGLILMVPLTSSIIQRIHQMDQHFAQQYKKIWPLRRHTSKRLIPFVY